jgi:Flp pilus assembly protein TadG
MKNNKGQVLTAFIIMIPIIFMLMAILFDVGLVYIEKRKIDNELKDVINYAFNVNKDDINIENDIMKIIKENNSYDKLIVDKNKIK